MGAKFSLESTDLGESGADGPASVHSCLRTQWREGGERERHVDQRFYSAFHTVFGGISPKCQ